MKKSTKSIVFSQCLMVISTLLTLVGLFLNGYGDTSDALYPGLVVVRKLYSLFPTNPLVWAIPVATLFAFASLFIRYKTKSAFLAGGGLYVLASGVVAAVLYAVVFSQNYSGLHAGVVIIAVGAVLGLLGGIIYMLGGLSYCRKCYNMSEYDVIKLEAIAYLFENRMLSVRERAELKGKLGLPPEIRRVGFLKFLYVVASAVMVVMLFLPEKNGFETSLAYAFSKGKYATMFIIPALLLIACVLVCIGRKPGICAAALGVFLGATFLSAIVTFKSGAPNESLFGTIFGVCAAIMLITDIIYAFALRSESMMGYIDPGSIEGQLKLLFYKLKEGEVKEKDYAALRNDILEILR